MPNPTPTPPTTTTSTTTGASQTEKIKAEAAMLRAQADLIKATAELAAANKLPDPAVAASNAEKARLDAAKGVLDSSKALADAKKAADLASVQAAIGSATGSNIEGTVTLKQDAGKGEATLLAAKALQTAAATIAAAVGAKVDGRRVLLLQGAEPLQFATYRQFLMQTDLLKRGFDVAQSEAESAVQRAEALLADRPLGEAAPPVSIAGAVIDAAAKLGSYFMTNYESGGIALTADVEQLAAAVAGGLLARNPRPEVVLPARRTPRADDFSVMVAPLVDRIKDADTRAGAATKLAADLKTRAGAATPADPRLQSAAKACEDAAAALKKAISKAEEFVASLGVADAKGVLLITKIAQEKVVADELAAKPGALALLLDVRSTAGGYYTKKNLWTFLGRMPFFVMGGVVVTHYLVDADGAVQASGLTPVHGGYMSVAEVEKSFTATTASGGPPVPTKP
jgi:hypothetical protein